MFHNISYRVFVNATENEIKVMDALKTIFPNARPKKELTEGFYGNPVIILSEKFDKKRYIKEFIDFFLDIGNNELKQIKKDLILKTDNSGNLFLRFDKQKAYNGIWKIVSHGDSIHVKLKVAAYPAKKSVSLEVMADLINTQIN